MDYVSVSGYRIDSDSRFVELITNSLWFEREFEEFEGWHRRTKERFAGGFVRIASSASALAPYQAYQFGESATGVLV